MKTEIRFVAVWHKLRELLSINSLLKNKMLVLTEKNLRFDILQGPQGVPAKEYLEFFVPFFSTGLGIMTGSRTILGNSMIRALEANNGKTPTIKQCIRQIEESRNSNLEGKRRLSERLNYLSEGIPGKIFCAKGGLTIEELATQNVAIVLEGLSMWHINIFLIAFLCSLIQLKKQQEVSQRVRHIVLADDVGELFSSGSSSFDEELNPSIAEKFASQYSREYMINLVLSTQFVEKLNPILLGNAQKFVSLQVGITSREVVAKHLGLDKDKSKYLGELERGHFLVYSGVNFPKAIYAETPLLNLPEISMSDSQKYAFVDEEVNEEKPTAETNINLSREEQVLLVFLKHNWWCTVSEIANKLGWPISKVSLLMKELVEKGFLESESYPTGKGSGNVRIHFYTAQAIKLFQEQKIMGKGGREHCWWQKRCAIYFENAGYMTEIEHFLSNGGESVDVVAKKDNLRTAIEIGLNKVEREIINVKKLKDFGQIIWATRSEITLKHMQTLVNSQLPELKYKILFMLLKSFLNAKGGMSNE